MTAARNIIVIGAGICGLSAAIWLRRAGHQVILIDRDGPWAGASYGNAGVLAQWAVAPISIPGLFLRSLRYITNPNEPVFIQWSQFPRLIPWICRFMAQSQDARARRTAKALIPLVIDSLDQHLALTRGTSAAHWISSSDFSFAYETRRAFEADRYSWALRAEAGYVPEVIEGYMVQEAEPILGPKIQCLALLKGHGHILNPGAYTEALALVFEQEGGVFRRAEALDISLTDGVASAVETDRGLMACNGVVLAAGIWSKPFLKKLGLKLPIVAERGYHLHLTEPSQTPRNPMMIESGKFAVNPMEHGLRCAGTVELGGVTKDMSRGPLDLIRKGVARAFPNLRYFSCEEWVGFRPSTADSLPLIGQIGRTGVYAALGHQHIGMTAGPKTGRIIADLISGQRPAIDLSAYDANRR